MVKDQREGLQNVTEDEDYHQGGTKHNGRHLLFC